MSQVFTLTKDANPNYLATICKIGELIPIEGSDFLAKTVVNGYDIVVSKDFKPGEIVLYFPVECCICEKYLSANNQYERSEFELNANADLVKNLLIQLEDGVSEEEGAQIAAKIKSMCGFFTKTGRVRIIKLRGQYSQGFVAKIDSLVNYNPEFLNMDWESLVGTKFNEVNGEVFCWKYIPAIKQQAKGNDSNGQSHWKKRMKRLKRFDKIIDGEFVFHYDTKMLAEHINELSPDDKVSITVKVHGTSVILSNILVKRQLSKWEKVKKFLGFDVAETEYGNVYSSRGVIKNQYINQNASSGFYGNDIWGCVNRDFGPYIEKGMTVYGEIVGYIEGSQTMIQKQHDYGCKPGCWKFMPYRITTTAPNGEKLEWELDAVNVWTKLLVAAHPELEDKVMYLTFIHYGRLGDMYPDIVEDENWNKNLLQRMKNDKEKILMELDEPMCKNKVPREGIVLRIIDDKFKRAWKLKSLRHYGKEAEQHDKGEVDLEEAESSESIE